VDPSPREGLLRRQRAYAFTHSSRRLLQDLQLWQALSPRLEPLVQLQLADLGVDPGSTAAAVPFTTADLSRRRQRGGLSTNGTTATDPEAAVGWIAQHQDVMAVLLTAIDRQPSIQLQLGQPPRPLDGSGYDLVVAADGPDSPSRQGLGIKQWQWMYQQRCLTAQVHLRGVGAQQAWELFRPEGPMALLPLGGEQVQVVWSAGANRCRQLEGIGSDAFLDRLAGALPDRFQPEALAVPPQTFAVGLALARRLQAGNAVLVGESGHRCHPVGGQGLNLCWRDVAVLHALARRVSQGRLAAAALPRRYARGRWLDVLLTLASTDLLVRLFSNRSPLLLPLRRVALVGLRRVSLLRRLSLGVMTDGPCRLPRR
jgi:2-octaprenyl-6-methoxyphenol hydroxylase